MKKWEKYLTKSYSNPRHAGSFSGSEKLYQAVKKEGKFRIGRARIRNWLKGNTSYTFNRIVHRKFKRNGVNTAGVDALWDADLMDFSSYSKENNGNRYVLLMIDIFTRYTWLRPLKTKSSADVIDKMKNIFLEGRKPLALRTDKGREFTNIAITKFYDVENVHHYVTFNDTQANYAERCIKTIKTKIYRYMKQNNKHIYIDVLQDIVKGYNNSQHRSLGATPISVNKDNEDEMRLQQYLLKNKQTKPRIKKENQKLKVKAYSFKLGDSVRISMIKGKFDREYDQRWSTETFNVSRRFRREQIPIYEIKDWEGDLVEGTFYAKELQKVIIKDNEEYIVEKILKKEGVNVYVKWKGWPSKFNTWMRSEDVKKL
jgi:transposase InsO family protein